MEREPRRSLRIYALTKTGGNWTKDILYSFMGAQDGVGPVGVILDEAGNLCGTAQGLCSINMHPTEPLSNSYPLAQNGASA